MRPSLSRLAAGFAIALAGPPDLARAANGENRRPIVGEVGPFARLEGELLAFSLPALDPDGDALEFRAWELPVGMRVGAESGLVHWRPARGQAGAHIARIFVTDGELGAFASFEIVVGDANRPPDVHALRDQTVTVGNRLLFRAAGEDPDGDPLTWSVEPLPEGASLDARTGDFEWTPRAPHLLRLTFVASDGRLADRETVTLRARAALPEAPERTGCGGSAPAAALGAAGTIAIRSRRRG